MNDAFVATLLSNTVIAALLGGCGWLAAHPLRRPALAHALFALALLKLVTPPLLHVHWSSPPSPAASVTLRAAASTFVATPQALPGSPGTTPTPDAAPAPASVVTPSIAAPRTAALDLAAVVVLLWSLGSGAALCLLVRRACRFRRFVRLLPPAGAQLLTEVQEAQRRVGLRRTPRVLLCDAALPPSVFAGRRGATLLVPIHLVEELDRPTRLGLWTHELAHVRRGDVWLRWFEAAVRIALWWHPLQWWLTHQLRAAEERACDAWATAGATPAQRRDYCDALLAIASATPAPVPLATSAVARGAPRRLRSWRRRLEDVMSREHPRDRRAVSRFVIALLAAAALPLAIAQEPNDTAEHANDKLDRTEIVFRVDEAPLEQWVEQLAHSAGLNLVIERSAIDADRTLTTLRDLQLPKATVRRVLDAISALTDLRWQQEDRGVIRIHHRSDTAPAPTEGVRCHGAFAVPGVVSIEPDETLLSLVARSRLTDRADLSAVQLIREVGGAHPLRLTVDIDAMLRTGQARANLLLQPGDLVTVPERLPDDLPPLTLRPGSRLHFVVDPQLLVTPGMEQLSVLTESQRVQRDGTIFVPFVGPVQVDGLGRDEVSDLVTRTLQDKFVNPLQVWARLE